MNKNPIINNDFIKHVHHKTHRQEMLVKPPSSALIISHNQFQKSILVTQIREMGISQISQTSHIHEARQKLEVNQNIDIVICDYEIHKGNDNAQTLLDDLRRCGILKLSTIVIFFSSYCTHQSISDAAETGIDVFLILPYSYKTLNERITNVQKRRIEFAEIYRHLEDEQYELAAEKCMERYIYRAYGWLYAGRVAAEIYIKQGEAKKAHEIFSSILEVNALPWAKIGLGRSQAEIGKLDDSIDTLSNVIRDNPEQTDAYDIMGRVYLEKGQPEKALEIYKLAVEATPYSISRLQRFGFAAMHAGNKEEGVAMLTKSVSLGVFSKMFDPRAFFVLAVEELDANNTKQINELIKKLLSVIKLRPEEKRLNRMFQLVEIIEMLAYKQNISARLKLENLLDVKLKNDFDHDSASSLLTILAIFAERNLHEHSDREQVSEIGLRFAHSKFCGLWLAGSASRYPIYSEIVAESFNKVFKECQKSMTIIVSSKDYTAGISHILDFATRYKNIKAIETADGMLTRYKGNLVNIEDLSEQIQQLKLDNNPLERRHYPANGYLRHPGGISLPKKL